MNKWNLIIDVAECTNCNLCTLAAMDEYVGNEFPGYSAPMPKHGHKWINILQKERGQVPTVDVAFVPTLCNHCDNAPCVAKGGGAVSKRDDGIVLIDPVKAKGRKDLVEACPYGHIWWNEELSLPQAWTFDAHLIDQGWKQTRGQQSCPTGAMRAICVDDDAMAKLAASRGWKPSGPSSAPARASTTRTCGVIRPASSPARCRRRRTAWSIASRGRRCACSRTAPWWRRPRPTITATSNSIGWARTPATTSSKSRVAGRANKAVAAKLGASINLGEIRL